MTPRRRLLIIQIDGLSGSRFERALAEGRMPHVAAHCRRPAGWSRRIESAPSTPAFHSAILYGRQRLVHGYTWFDRERGIVCRFDCPDDVAAVEAQLAAGASRPPLLARKGTTSYLITFVGGAGRAFLTFATGLLPAPFWRKSHITLGLLRGAMRAPYELAAGLFDMAAFVAKHRTTLFEWNWLAMRLLHAVALEEIGTRSAVHDLTEGAGIVYANFIAYDEASHRRGPEHPVALAQLVRIDARIARLLAAGARFGYEVVLCSDHGQAAAVPFTRVEGRTLSSMVFEACAPGPIDARFRELTDRLDHYRLQSAQVRKFPGFGKAVDARARRLARRAARDLEKLGVPAGELAVVTGGSIAHIYVGRHPDGSSLEEIEARFPQLLPALTASPGIGLVVARRSQGGAVVLRGGERACLSDRPALAGLEPFQVVGTAALSRVIHAVIDVGTSGDLVVYGAFAGAGNVTFDPELGSHGGIHPDELEAFVVEPDGETLLADGAFDPVALNASLRRRYA